MVDIAKLPVQGSIGILSRYAAGRVNPYTVLVCEALCNRFHLTARGRSNIESAVASLTTVGAVGATLEFGFGVEDLVRSMTKSEQGTVVLALCAALMECYSLDIATEILLELARLSEVGGHWMPSSREWKAMLSACAGVLAPTSFGTKAEVLMQLHSSGRRLEAFQGLWTHPEDMRKCSSPKAIAEALFAMSAISRRDMEAITIIGGPDTGWLAAVAEWILDLRVSISNPRGEILYINTKSPQAAQINIICGAQTASATQEVATEGRTYILKEFSAILDGVTPSSIDTIVSGRIEWKRALRSAFLLDFKRLMDKMPTTLGTLLGSVARIFKGIVMADKSFPIPYLAACTSYCDQSFGPGFINNVIHWFPELAKLQDHMEKAVAVPLKEAKENYEISITRLRQYCCCRACENPSNGFEIDDDVDMTLDSIHEDSTQTYVADIDEHPESLCGTEADEGESHWDAYKYCAVILAETIIVLSRTLATVSLDDGNLLPMRSGFELAYDRQLNMRRLTRSGWQALKDLGQIAFCIGFAPNFSVGLSEYDYGTGIRLDLILELFSGEKSYLSKDKVSAACSRGLCAYFRILKDVSLKKLDIASISIIPGRIHFEKKSYETLEDRSFDHCDVFETTLHKLIRTGKAFDNVKLSIRESSTALECLLQLPRSGYATDNDETVVAGPAHLANLIAARRGLVSCRQTGRGEKPCQKVKTLKSTVRNRLTSEGGYVSVRGRTREAQGRHFFDCRHSLVARVTLAHCAVPWINRGSIFLIDRECVDCCLNTAVETETGEDVYFFRIADA